MNLGGQSEGTQASSGGVFVQFNQDCTSLVAGSSTGYHLFALTADDGLEHMYASRSGHECVLVDRLFSSSLVAYVTLQAPRKLIVCHYKRGTEICNYSYSNTILAIKLNRMRLVVCLEESLHIHNLRDMKILHTIRDTPRNARGLAALAASQERCLLAYPGSGAQGEVHVFDCVQLRAVCSWHAHEAALAALAWSADGARLATASERGTVIRVFSVPDPVRLFEFRRGVKRCVSISCLAWSACGTLLAAASNTETIHVFRCSSSEGGGAGGAGAGAGAGAGGEGAGAGGAEEGAADEGWAGWLSAAVSAGATLLPAGVSGVLAQGRAFAAARLPATDNRATVAITNVSKSPRLVVATSAGLVYVFSLDTRDGGECTLLRTHRLFDTPPPNTEMSATDSYARALRPRPDTLTDSDRGREMEAALESTPSPPKAYDLRDPQHFPPMPSH